MNWIAIYNNNKQPICYSVIFCCYWTDLIFNILYISSWYAQLSADNRSWQDKHPEVRINKWENKSSQFVFLYRKQRKSGNNKSIKWHKIFGLDVATNIQTKRKSQKSAWKQFNYKIIENKQAIRFAYKSKTIFLWNKTIKMKIGKKNEVNPWNGNK